MTSEWRFGVRPLSDKPNQRVQPQHSYRHILEAYDELTPEQTLCFETDDADQKQQNRIRERLTSQMRRWRPGTEPHAQIDQANRCVWLWRTAWPTNWHNPDPPPIERFEDKPPAEMVAALNEAIAEMPADPEPDPEIEARRRRGGRPKKAVEPEPMAAPIEVPDDPCLCSIEWRQDREFTRDMLTMRGAWHNQYCPLHAHRWQIPPTVEHGQPYTATCATCPAEKEMDPWARPDAPKVAR